MLTGCVSELKDVASRHGLTEILGELGAHGVLDDVRRDGNPDSIKPCDIDMMFIYQGTAQTQRRMASNVSGIISRQDNPDTVLGNHTESACLQKLCVRFDRLS